MKKSDIMKEVEGDEGEQLPESVSTYVSDITPKWKDIRTLVRIYRSYRPLLLMFKVPIMSVEVENRCS